MAGTGCVRCTVFRKEFRKMVNSQPRPDQPRELIQPLLGKQKNLLRQIFGIVNCARQTVRIPVNGVKMIVDQPLDV